MKLSHLIIIGYIIFSPSISHAFMNSLDSTTQQNNVIQTQTRTNNFSGIKSPTEHALTPKEHTGFEHQDRQFPNPTMNDTRYNSNCQFGACTPGGLNPNNK